LGLERVESSRSLAAPHDGICSLQNTGCNLVDTSSCSDCPLTIDIVVLRFIALNKQHEYVGAPFEFILFSKQNIKQMSESRILNFVVQRKGQIIKSLGPIYLDVIYVPYTLSPCSYLKTGYRPHKCELCCADCILPSVSRVLWSDDGTQARTFASGSRVCLSTPAVTCLGCDLGGVEIGNWIY
jgi:hypothetical protein